MVQSLLEISGLQKASILLMSLGSATSAEVLKHLNPRERELLGTQIVKMTPVGSVVRQRVLDEVNEMISRSKSRDLMESEPSPGAPLRWLEKLDPADVAETLCKERPHNIAMVVSHLAPSAAANVISHLEEKTRNSVLHRLATMGPVSPEAVKAVDELLLERAKGKLGLSRDRSRSSDAVLRILGDVTDQARKSMQSVVSRTDSSAPAVAIGVPSSVEDMIGLSDHDIRSVLAETDIEDLSLALRVASEELKSTLLRNVPEAAAACIRANCEGQFQVKVREIEAAQQRIVDILRAHVRQERSEEPIALWEAAA